MSGRCNNAAPISIEKNGSVLTDSELAEELNNFFLSVNADIPALDLCYLPSFLPATEPLPIIQPYEVCKKIAMLNSCKATGPDKIPSRILNEFAFELAEPVTHIFNVSLSSGIFPHSWKRSEIIPIPKIQPVAADEDLRPISLTPCLSKVLEDFVVKWLIADVGDKIDPQQFGTSTT